MPMRVSKIPCRRTTLPLDTGLDLVARWCSDLKVALLQEIMRIAKVRRKTVRTVCTGVRLRLAERQGGVFVRPFFEEGAPGNGLGEKISMSERPEAS